MRKNNLRIYSQIVGVMLTITLLMSLLFIVWAFFDNEEPATLLFLIPTIIFLHYMYIHNFGLGFESTFTEKNGKLIILFTAISILGSTVTPIIIYVNHQIEVNKEYEMLSFTKKGEMSLIEGTKAILKLKYNARRGNMDYKFSFKKDDESMSFYFRSDREYFLELFDEDGFSIQKIFLNHSRLRDANNRVIGIFATSQSYFEIDDYNRIKDFSIGWNDY